MYQVFLLADIRMVGRQQAIFYERGPKGQRDFRRQSGDILWHALGLAGAEGQGDDARVRFAKLNADLGRVLPIGLAEGKELLPPGELLLIRRLAGVQLDIIEKFAACEETGIEDRRVDDSDASGPQFVHEGQQGRRVRIERVAISEHHPIQLDLSGDFLDSRPVFRADADGLGRAPRFELAKGGVSAEDVVEAAGAVGWRGRCRQIFIGVMHGDQRRFVLAAEQLQPLLKAAQNAGVADVLHGIMFQAEPGARLKGRLGALQRRPDIPPAQFALSQWGQCVPPRKMPWTATACCYPAETELSGLFQLGIPSFAALGQIPNSCTRL